MTMPLRLTLVRHGESEGNVAHHASLRGDDSCFTAEFLERHSRTWRLTERGREQARATGEWIRSNNPPYSHYFTSDYFRARETAALLGLENAQWRVDFYLRERDWGDLDVMCHRDRLARFAENIERRAINGFLWCPPNGETMVEVCGRVDRMLDTLHRECTDGRAIIVCHGEVMWAFRMRLERLTIEDWNALDASENPCDHIYNGQVVEYSRVHPENPNDVRNAPMWRHSTCPSDLGRSSNVWRPIVRRTFSNADLLASIS
ncbi:hypothetical protein A2348_01490 [Candidatus Uhrbacteria bacterium RIFOXYB12_FULL_58_10]|uniref:phosphoglycerate mutase (2,3-diphosphoglycerate-dependent) n=1 Tax=Candidatus Uhrbacteria bacterium RIFOXYB2_FULL_57_15 TaxID=1802422 RepID=A0A1F7W610_9BACT|nr:MAG: hypothetical protein A2348_01490 [Candidatus Uhrbacteria bacterium RIFOXYB12_FULL_58_10]OGL98056.1 MAG: hypothetical protein A2304_00920 [Candidatus Uhrbacteria bacterium RIFOXYB2_FULL_57_15]OGL99735.1 MAG: hypothetical protein A2501_00260 [Candidatus Uhrbacteria bacterium RIFOXYC12_FULL_57_11]